MKTKDNNGWISVNDRLPDLEVYVLAYDTIQNSKKDEVSHYIYIARLISVTQYKSNKSTEWQDKEYNGVEPLFWQPLPKYPTISEKNKQ